MCSCRAHGLSCVGACGDCRGVDCLNVDATAMNEEEDEDSEIRKLFLLNCNLLLNFKIYFFR